MNRKKIKVLRRRAKEFLVLWMKSLLPEEEQKKLRRGVKDSAKIFNKARLRDALKQDHLKSGRSGSIGVRASDQGPSSGPKS